MSLLLLFPSTATGSAAASTGWSQVICTGASWAVFDCEQFSTWGEWSSNQWNQIYNSPLTTNQSWNYMAGFTFQATTCTGVSWATTTC